MPCTPKKTVEIIVEGGNDYMIGVKGNQQTLLNYCQQATHEQSPLSSDHQAERSRGRFVERIVRVYEAPHEVKTQWLGAQVLIQVLRRGIRANELFECTSYYISSLASSAIELGLGIRGHRDIENGLHWVKDVVLGEDAARFREINAATNWSIIRNIVLNLFRGRGYRSLTQAQRFVSHDIEQLFSLLTIN